MLAYNSFVLRVQGSLQYRPHLLTGEAAEKDWVQSLELSGARSFMLEQATERPLRTLILYGSLRHRSYSRLLAYEFARWWILLELPWCTCCSQDSAHLPRKASSSASVLRFMKAADCPWTSLCPRPSRLIEKGCSSLWLTMLTAWCFAGYWTCWVRRWECMIPLAFPSRMMLQRPTQRLSSSVSWACGPRRMWVTRTFLWPLLRFECKVQPKTQAITCQRYCYEPETQAITSAQTVKNIATLRDITHLQSFCEVLGLSLGCVCINGCPRKLRCLGDLYKRIAFGLR